ncbi:hypothetical protein DFJ58DRAFT_882805 [Suillus subalutaceus]|uniref:uncharacterized protein n=1 Tax=Suillus subalutaceus TaxID=48586 RepID=UPI001B85B505|nr:uncharacterized protein DFJ58DRAFT_882805 [Suillus subalutaceus]KAG1854491.1 hypothetical protein DFJ58DRAFT_882805 [Suillus subalutaceus]
MSTNAPVKLNISDLPSTSRCPVHWHASLNNMCHSGSGISDLYDIVDAIRSMTISDADNLEANLVLDLARARRDVVNAEKVLADCVVREHEVLANLSKHKSDISKQNLAKADNCERPPAPPSRPSMFYGRGDLVAELTNLVVNGEHIALIGPGGMGKSSLAKAILHEPDIMENFADRRYFVTYDGLDPSTITFQTFMT